MLSRHRTKHLAVAAFAIALSAAAWADQSGNATLTANTYLNLDTGAMSNAGGDILWNGTAVAPQGRAGLYNLGKYGSRVFKSIAARSAAGAPYSAAPIPAGTLVAGDVFGVHTNGGHYAKVIVTAVNGASLSLQYTTFITAGIAAGSNTAVKVEANAAFGPPVFIFQVQNNYSFLLPGVPNYGIAPGSLFAIQGQNLNGTSQPVLQSSAAPGLPTTLNQTSLSVTVNDVTTTPALYYASSTALAAVLPSNTPVGAGTITVTYNGQVSQPAPIQVVPSAVGLDTLYGTGAGSAVVTDANFNVLGLTNSAMPGQTVTLWGSGVGADTSNDDRTYPLNQNNLTNIPMQVYIGGIPANVLYRGRSQFPGLDQIDVVVPASVPLGCYLSVVVETGSIVSNSVSLPVSPKGGACSDPALGLSGTQLQSLANKGVSPVKSVALVVSQQTGLNGAVSDGVLAFSISVNSSEFGAGYLYPSEGSCSVYPPGYGFPFPIQGPLDAGEIQLTGPSGGVDLQLEGEGFYVAQLPSGSVTSNPGAYTFVGSGGKDVGAFNVAINVQTPFSLTNKTALASITRSQGATITWSGGFTGGEVMVKGVGASTNGSVNFYCHVPSSAGQLTIPVSNLLALPPGNGKLIVFNTTALQTVSASGLDLGLAAGVVSYELFTAFK
ncbi:MAG TPA: hypothetical protein VGG72_13875 [Bryobacteraceae bacterium]|jgi:uncharacterized protein (TIGR03437 family)